MRSCFTDGYDETYARLCITECFRDLNLSLVRRENDPPDLEDNINNVGIEVVRSTLGDNEALWSAFSEYQGRPIESINEKRLAKITSDSGNRRKLLPDENGNVAAALAVFEFDDEGTRLQPLHLIECVLRKKLEILNEKRYPRYERDGLFICNSGGFCFEEELLEWMSSIIEGLKDEYKRLYDFIIIYCDHQVYLCDFERRSVREETLTDKQIERLKKESLTCLGRKEAYEELP